MRAKDKEALLYWEQFRQDIIKSSYIEPETLKEKQQRIAKLEANPEQWFKYYFEKYYTSEPAKFHIQASKRLIAQKNWYEVRAWARELAKTARAMFEIIYLAMIGEIKNILIVSNSYENAERLLKPYKIILESSGRIRNDYGGQVSIGAWGEGEFTTLQGVAFRAIGAGQSPRGTRNENSRPDVILIDDIDTDEDTRNPRIINQRWNWIEQALIPTVSVSNSFRVLFNGNIIAKDCCITRAIQNADHASIINIRDSKGKSVWPEKNTEEAIEYLLSKISYASAQKEFYNNPITQGSIFKTIAYKKILPLNQYRYIVCYTDPSYKDTKTNDYKATVVIGKTAEGEFHVIWAFIAQTSLRQMVNWHYQISLWASDKATIFYYMEANFIQDLLLEEFQKAGQETGKYIPVKGDTRKKPNKFQRIEGLEPYFSRGMWYFNEDEKDNPNMKLLVEQFECFEMGMRSHDDGPDACEGAVYILNNRTKISDIPFIGKNTQLNKNRY